MANHCFSLVLHLSHVSLTSKNGFNVEESNCMSSPNRINNDIFSLGTYIQWDFFPIKAMLSCLGHMVLV